MEKEFITPPGLRKHRAYTRVITVKGPRVRVHSGPDAAGLTDMRRLGRCWPASKAASATAA